MTDNKTDGPLVDIDKMSVDDMEDRPPYPKRLKKKKYYRELEALQIELVKCQYWVKDAAERVVIIFEGRDAAGKGGSIARFKQYLNPRGAPHVALPIPNDTEKTQWYFQRYVSHLPAAGQIIFFDRSWYNRAGVERVMGFSSPHDYFEFVRQVPGFERAIVDSGIRMFKLWFTVDKAEQLYRFERRKTNPLKQWKLSSTDEAALSRFDEYTQARDAMFSFSDTADSPWIIVNSNDKRRARLNSIRHVLHALPYEGKDLDAIGETDPRVVSAVSDLVTNEADLTGDT